MKLAGDRLLFIHGDGRLLITYQCISFKKGAYKVGAHELGSHSFWTGAETTAAQLGFRMIQAIGQWHLDTYRTYVKPKAENWSYFSNYKSCKQAKQAVV